MGVAEDVLELLHQALVAAQSLEQTRGLEAPEHSPMLHARARNSDDFRSVQALVFQSGDDQVDCLEPHGVWGVYLALCGVCEDAMFDAVFRPEVFVEVCMGLIHELEVVPDNDAFRGMMS